MKITEISYLNGQNTSKKQKNNISFPFTLILLHETVHLFTSISLFDSDQNDLSARRLTKI